MKPSLGRNRRVIRGAALDFLVRAHDSTDGSLLWDDLFDRTGGDDVALGITPAGGRVFALGGADLDATFVGIPLIRAYDRATGALAWQHEVAGGQGVFGAAVVHEGRVIAVGGNTKWLVQACKAQTGAVLWRDRFGAGSSNRAPGVAEGGGRVADVAVSVSAETTTARASPRMMARSLRPATSTMPT